MTARLVCAALVLATIACKSSMDSGAPPVALLGSWHYVATESPGTTTLDGTLEVSRQSGHDLDGMLDVTQDDAQGHMARLSGIVSGRAVDSMTIDFDAFLSASARRHVGTVKGDSMTGTWVEQATSGGVTASGQFRAARAGGIEGRHGR